MLSHIIAIWGETSIWSQHIVLAPFASARTQIPLNNHYRTDQHQQWWHTISRRMLVECDPNMIAIHHAINAGRHARELREQIGLVQPQPAQQVGRAAVESLVIGFIQDSLQLIAVAFGEIGDRLHLIGGPWATNSAS